ncbi:MAG: hypothetical protein A2901_06020 [Elusimicrobia bacterium RIFCSPLOWO2_01_FULL_54_10]|nr:MAG: hypothetical protein A2901_06020 [Elusimicrobia bacterium RIFCSPLOWO2_01_FULL_54_10]
MIKVTQLLVALGILAGGGMGAKSYALDVPEAVANHHKMAAGYDQKVQEQDAVINEHRDMKSKYKERLYINDKATPPSRFEAMNKHCDSIIRQATKLRTEYSDFSKWHRMRAGELQGK